jgi:hypothetical protein
MLKINKIKIIIIYSIYIYIYIKRKEKKRAVEWQLAMVPRRAVAQAW